MAKRKHSDAVSGNRIAERLVAKMKRELRGKVVNRGNVIAGRAAAEEQQKTVVTKEALAGLHPAHAAYVYSQNQFSVMSEQVTTLDETAPFAEIVSKAEDLYVPSGPPISPLTTSYFTCWAFFDACVGPTNETIGTTVLELGAAFGMHAELLRLIRLMQESRMGLYVHEGAENGLGALRDVVTGAVCGAISPAGYRGKRGELWYARVSRRQSPAAPNTSSSRRRTLCCSRGCATGRRTSAALYLRLPSRRASTLTHAT
jgi:hypothetical protein